MRLIACALLLSLIACGQKGQLYLPPPEAAQIPPPSGEAATLSDDAEQDADQPAGQEKDKNQ